MSRPPRIPFAIALALAALAGIASGKGKDKQVRFVGVHPIVRAHGGGLCHIEVPHVHIYAPGEPVQYRDHDGFHYFVGDPVAYGWDGVKTSYYGHHPVYIDAVVEAAEDPGEPVYCYINGPHYHGFAPPAVVAADWKLDGNAYFYVGTPPPVYVEARPELVRVNAIYEPIEYTRPVVTVEPPAAWIGIRFAMPVVVIEEPRARPAAVVVDEVVVPGGVTIDVRPPSFSVDVGIGVSGGGGVILGGGGHKKHKPEKPKKLKLKSKGGGGIRVRDHRR